ncbi:hypothetical protein AJ80_04545 [Polytolypa hystricis UAMH7299]|uniref:Uncharacterized protein n=1 Tax=Polytolypa hystricis (strain UAMH7299) TaxID=1447883 RepID=A0A2B7YB58_POLH7|nr:hypothetical protein AJ80_04545 [Polytolypa hystricis UAMH7299]
MDFSPANPSTAGDITMSPASLLWAHQLRREHKVLLSRLTALETSASASTDATISSFNSLTSRLEALETAIGDIRRDIERVKESVDTLKQGHESCGAEREQLRGKLEEEVKFKGDILQEVKGLRETIDDLRMRIRMGTGPPVQDLAMTQVPKSSSLSTGQRHLCRRQLTPDHITIPSTISGTPTVSQVHTPTPHGSPLLVPDSLPLPTESATTQVQLPLLSSPPSTPTPERKDRLLTTLRQGSLSLSAYIALGESVVEEFQDPVAEDLVVAMFSDGLNDHKLQFALKKKLGQNGERWNVVRAFMKNEILRDNEGKRKRDGREPGKASRKKKKKRRVIPLVWPVEGEEEGGPRIPR